MRTHNTGKGKEKEKKIKSQEREHATQENGKKLKVGNENTQHRKMERKSKEVKGQE